VLLTCVGTAFAGVAHAGALGLPLAALRAPHAPGATSSLVVLQVSQPPGEPTPEPPSLPPAPAPAEPEPQPASEQSNADDEWVMGYRLDVTHVGFTGALHDSVPQSPYGFAFGVFASLPTRTWLRFQPELVLTVKGGRFDSPVYIADTTSTGADTTFFIGSEHRTVDITYLELPLLLELPIGRSGHYQPHLQGGVAPALRLFSRFRNGAYTGTEPINPDKANRFDIAWLVGVGINITTRRATLRFDLRYEKGMLDVFTPPNGPPGHNEQWSLGVAITP
jgi:hypothetical protein